MIPPRISIIIPVYYVESYMTDCLQSVMLQDYKGSIECILVDDCGTDRSMTIAEQLIAEYEGPIEFKILHHEHNRGLSAARNTGMDAATGDYVYFLDSDDWISDDCIEKLAKPLQNEAFDIVVGDYKTVGQPPCGWKLWFEEGKYDEKGINNTFCNNGIYVMVWNKLYNKNFLDRNHLRFEEGRIFEDEILAFELSCLENTFYVIRSITYYYRRRDDSIIASKDQLKTLANYVGVFQSVKGKIERYKNVDGIFDFYMFWIMRVFGWVYNYLEMDDKMGDFVQKQTEGYLDVIPGICYLKNKHNRMLYFACKRNQTYLRFQYVSNVYADKLKGRILRNILNLFPYRTYRK